MSPDCFVTDLPGWSTRVRRPFPQTPKPNYEKNKPAKYRVYYNCQHLLTLKRSF